MARRLLNNKDEPQGQLCRRCITNRIGPTCGVLIEHLVGRTFGLYCTRNTNAAKAT